MFYSINIFYYRCPSFRLFYKSVCIKPSKKSDRYFQTTLLLSIQGVILLYEEYRVVQTKLTLFSVHFQHLHIYSVCMRHIQMYLPIRNSIISVINLPSWVHSIRNLWSVGRRVRTKQEQGNLCSTIAGYCLSHLYNFELIPYLLLLLYYINISTK